MTFLSDDQASSYAPQQGMSSPTAPMSDEAAASYGATVPSQTTGALAGSGLNRTNKPAELAPAAKQYELQMSSALGAPYDLGKGVMPDSGLAFTIGRLMATGDPQAAADAFLSKYPGGDLKSVGSDLAWRSGPDEPYQRLGGSASIGGMLTARNVLPIASMVVSPEIGVAGKAISMIPKVGDIAASIAAKFPIIANALRFGSETSGGSGVDSIINAATGNASDTDIIKELSKAGTSGTEAGGAALATGGILKTPGALASAGRFIKGLMAPGGVDAASDSAGNWLSSLIMKTADPELMKLSKDASDAGMAPLNQGQVGHPVARVIAGQVGAVSTALKNSKITQIDSLRQNLQGIVDANSDAGTQSGALGALVDAQKSEIAAMAPIAQKLGVSDMGATLQGQINDTITNARQLVRDKMSTAAVAAGSNDIQIPTDALKGAAADIQRGVVAPGASGQPVQLQDISPQIANDLNKVQALGPNFGNMSVGGKTDDAFTQFMTLRDNWYDLMTNSTNPVERQQAYKLWSASQQSIQDAFSGIGSAAGPAFQQAKADAIKSFTDYNDTRTLLNGIANSNTPGKMADTLVQPGKGPILSVLKNTGGIDTVADGFRTRLINNLPVAEKTITGLQAADPAVINSVLKPDEQAAWISLSRNIQALQKTTTSGLTGGTAEGAANAITIAQNAPASEINRFSSASGGYSGSYAAGLRNGIYSDILSNVGQPAAFATAIDKYIARAPQLGSVLNSGDIAQLQMFKKYSNVVGPEEQQGVSSYGGLSAGSQGKVLYDIAGLVRDRAKFAMTVLNMVNKEGMARVLAMPAGSQMMTQAIKAGPNSNGIQWVSRMAGLAAQTGLRQTNENIYAQSPSVQKPPVWDDTQQ